MTRALARMPPAHADRARRAWRNPGWRWPSRPGWRPQASSESGPDVAWVELAPMSDPQVIAPDGGHSGSAFPRPRGWTRSRRSPLTLTVRRDASAGLVLVVLDNCRAPRFRRRGPRRAPCWPSALRSASSPPAGSLLALRESAPGRSRHWGAPMRPGCSRARTGWSHRPSASPTANRQTVAQVSPRKLDDLPLAIELAAARMRVLSVRQLAETA